MHIRTLYIFSRFHYDESLIPEHGTPLWNIKRKCPVPPTATIRVGDKFLTAKQVVYLLNLSDAYPLPDDTNPRVELPLYLLNKDDDPNNIRIDNLQARNTSRRWSHHNKQKHVLSDEGVWFPRSMLATMTREEMVRHGVSPDHASPP